MIRTRAGFVVKSFQRRVALPLLALALLFVASPESLLRSRAQIGADAPSAAADENERAQARRRAARRRGGVAAPRPRTPR